MTMTTSYISPVAELREFVHRIVTIETTENGILPTVIPCYADGYPGIVIQDSPGGMFVAHSGRRLGPFFLYGQTVSPISLEARGRSSMIIFYLYPHVIHSITCVSPRDIVDGCLDLTLLPDPGVKVLISRLNDAAAASRKIEIVSKYLAAVIRRNNVQLDTTIQYAIQDIRRSAGVKPVGEVRRSLRLSQRAFERRFVQQVGVPPKLFSRIVQFQSTLTMLKGGGFEKLSDVAYAYGYADQSHFIRSFRRFTGSSPLVFGTGKVADAVS